MLRGAIFHALFALGKLGIILRALVSGGLFCVCVAGGVQENQSLSLFSALLGSTVDTRGVLAVGQVTFPVCVLTTTCGTMPDLITIAPHVCGLKTIDSATVTFRKVNTFV